MQNHAVTPNNHEPRYKDMGSIDWSVTTKIETADMEQKENV